MKYPKPTQILLDDAGPSNAKRGGRKKGILLQRDQVIILRVTQYEKDILTLASHVCDKSYNDLLVVPAMQKSIALLLEAEVDIPTSAPPAPNPVQAKPSNAK